MEGGNEMHRETMKKICDKCRCGKAIDLGLAGEEGTRFAGVWVGWHQQQDQTWRRLTRSFHLGITDDRHC